MTETLQIRCNKDFLDFLDLMESNTSAFFDSNLRSMTGMESIHVQLETDLEFSEKMCRRIGGAFKYFKGVFDGNNHTISAICEKTTSLFSSIYFSKVRNLNIHNMKGSRSFILADDALGCEFENVNLTGSMYVSESIGAFVRTAQQVTFRNCDVELETSTFFNTKPTEDNTAEKEDDTPPYFGGFVGVDLGETKFIDCSISGKISSEVAVGGFCAIARNSVFTDCNVLGLTVTGNREVGLFVGRGSQDLRFDRCIVTDSTAVGNYWVSYLVGKSTGKIYVNKLLAENCFINPKSTLSYAGGIAGSADGIYMYNSTLQGSINAHIILAGISPDVADCELGNNNIELSITAIGYQPMMTHAYKLVREDFLTTDGKEIKFAQGGNNAKVTLVELELEGTFNPFEESLL